MRVTHSTVTRNYLRNMRRVNYERNKSSNRITSGAKFSRASESPIEAAKALNVRKALSNIETYQDNLKTSNVFYAAAESTLIDTSSILATIREQTLYATNGTQGPTEQEILSETIYNYCDEFVKMLNTDSAGRMIFGGESDAPSPFALETNASGEKFLTYHGVDISSLDDPSNFPYSNEVFADVGLGISVDQQTQQVDPQSALKISFNGAEITGCGVDGDGDPKNFVQIALNIANALKDHDTEEARGLIDKLVDSHTNVLVSIADIGNAEEFIEFTQNRMTAQQFNLQERQNDLEATDKYSEITNWKSLDATYNAVLQMSTSVLPTSIFNFMK